MVDGEDRQDPLFDSETDRPPPPSEAPTTPFEEDDPPAAGPGQLTFEPTFAYKSARRRTGERSGRPSLRTLVGRLEQEQKIAAIAAIGFVVSLFTPWWQQPGKLQLTEAGVSHISFVELAILLISASVLLLLYRRAEGRVFHLPLSDGTLAAGAGAWCAFLLVYRMFDPPSFEAGTRVLEYDPHWGMLVALACAALLFATGVRGRQHYHAGESEAHAADADATPTEPIYR